jgi:hypothetical protein
MPRNKLSKDYLELASDKEWDEIISENERRGGRKIRE